MAAEQGSQPLSALISRADRTGLLAVVVESLHRFTERDALQVLRHPALSGPVIEEILFASRLLGFRAVRKAIAMHPASPRPAAIECLSDLLWRDLVDIGRNARTPMPVRRVANQHIMERLPRLAVGEKTSLARLADRALVPALLDVKERRVFAALLQNPRLDPDQLVAWIGVGAPDAPRLTDLASDPRWNRHPGIRGALLASPETPRAVALGLLGSGTRAEWRRLMDNPSADPLLSACARRLYEEPAPAGLTRDHDRL